MGADTAIHHVSPSVLSRTGPSCPVSCISLIFKRTSSWSPCRRCAGASTRRIRATYWRWWVASKGFEEAAAAQLDFSFFSVVEIDSVRITRGLSYLGGLVADGWYRWVLVARCPSRLGAQFRCGCRKSARKPGWRDRPLPMQPDQASRLQCPCTRRGRAPVGASQSMLTCKTLRTTTICLRVAIS